MPPAYEDDNFAIPTRPFHASNDHDATGTTTIIVPNSDTGKSAHPRRHKSPWHPRQYRRPTLVIILPAIHPFRRRFPRLRQNSVCLAALTKTETTTPTRPQRDNLHLQPRDELQRWNIRQRFWKADDVPLVWWLNRTWPKEDKTSRRNCRHVACC